jgi:hypothetical protein
MTRWYGLASVWLLAVLTMYVTTPAQAASSSDTDLILSTSKQGATSDLTEFYARNLGLTLPGDGTAAVAAPVAARASSAPPVDGGAANRILAMADEVDSRDLGSVQGGFALPSGLDVSFGFDIATSVGGAVVQQLTVPTTNLTTGVTQSVPMSVTSAGNNFSISLPVGSSSSVSVTSLTNSGLTAVTTALGAGGVTSLLQNRANNQVLQQVNTFNLSITGMSQMLAQRVTQNMVGVALGSANMLRR